MRHVPGYHLRNPDDDDRRTDHAQHQDGKRRLHDSEDFACQAGFAESPQDTAQSSELSRSAIQNVDQDSPSTHARERSSCMGGTTIREIILTIHRPFPRMIASSFGTEPTTRPMPSC